MGAYALEVAARAYFYVGLWMTVSISVILFNKWLLAFSGFPYPITLTLWHMVFCSTAGFICIRVLKVSKTFNMSVEEYVTRVMPIGMLYAASLWLSNGAYLYLSVSFIQMTKSLMPGLVYFSGNLIGTERFSWRVVADMALIAFGVLVCAFGEHGLSARGLATQLTALLFEATRLTLVQVLINCRGMKMDPFQSLYYVSPACLAALTVPFFIVELPAVAALARDPTWTFRPAVFLANAGAAFLLNLAVFMLIGKTSALTMNIAGVIKDWMLIYSSYSVFKAPVTALNLAGYAFCCSGVGLYQYIKYHELRHEGKSAHPAGKPGGSPNAECGRILPMEARSPRARAKGNRHPPSAPTSGAAGAHTGQGHEVPVRNKAEVLADMEALQAELASLERVAPGGGRRVAAG